MLQNTINSSINPKIGAGLQKFIKSRIIVSELPYSGQIYNYVVVPVPQNCTHADIYATGGGGGGGDRYDAYNTGGSGGAGGSEAVVLGYPVQQGYYFQTILGIGGPVNNNGTPSKANGGDTTVNYVSIYNTFSNSQKPFLYVNGTVYDINTTLLVCRGSGGGGGIRGDQSVLNGPYIALPGTTSIGNYINLGGNGYLSTSNYPVNNNSPGLPGGSTKIGIGGLNGVNFPGYTLRGTGGGGGASGCSLFRSYGGNGGSNSSIQPTVGTLGGGGGGSCAYQTSAAIGGNGVVIIDFY